MDEKYRTRERYSGTLQIKSDRRDIVVERAAKLLENSFETLDEALGVFRAAQDFLNAFDAELLACRIAALRDAVGEKHKNVALGKSDRPIGIGKIGNPVGDRRRVHDDLVNAECAFKQHGRVVPRHAVHDLLPRSLDAHRHCRREAAAGAEGWVDVCKEPEGE